MQQCSNATTNLMNQYGAKKIPFLFIIDFEAKKPVILKLSEIKNSQIKYYFNNKSNVKTINIEPKNIYFRKQPPTLKFYKKGFDIIKQNINKGNTYLLNYTLPAKIDTNLSLTEIFFRSKAKYKLLYNNEFVCFSPEIFVTINNGIISSYPMKGTIDASIPNARQIILNDKKETAEHNTIVDLIRNDLNIVSKQVRVEKFRYIDKIITNEKNLFQVSSKISGTLPANYNENIGDIINKLLPAGSISGAPKKKTCEIIKTAENYQRGYYTGVAGIFDGKNLDSCVIIRYMERRGEGLIYKSGGGITSFSDINYEYAELIDKIYIPI